MFISIISFCWNYYIDNFHNKNITNFCVRTKRQKTRKCRSKPYWWFKFPPATAGSWSNGNVYFVVVVLVVVVVAGSLSFVVHVIFSRCANHGKVIEFTIIVGVGSLNRTKYRTPSKHWWFIVLVSFQHYNTVVASTITFISTFGCSVKKKRCNIRLRYIPNSNSKI